MPWDDFREWMKREYRAGTGYQYWLRCRRFLGWAGISSPDQLKNITPDVFIKYDDYLKQKGLVQRSVDGFAIRSLLEYYGLYNLVGKVPARREWVQHPPKWLPLPLIMLMLDYAPNLRVKSLVALGYDLALRINEILALDIRPKSDRPWVDLKKGSANIYRLKTKQYPWMMLQVSDWALKILQEYCAKYRSAIGDALFTTTPYQLGGRGGGRMSAGTAERIWGRWIKSLGLDPGVWQYKTLRHSRLTWMAVEGKNLIEIAKFAGHSSPNPTLIYTHLSMMWLRQPEMFIEELKGSKLYGPARNMVLSKAMGGV